MSQYRPPLAHLTGRQLEVATDLALHFQKSAVERDRLGGTAREERQRLRQSGLLCLSVPAEWGGGAAPWAVVLDVVRLFSRVDSSMGHVFGFHHLMLATVQLFGSDEQWQRLASGTVRGDWFWGNALNPLDQRTSITRAGDHYVVSGTKSFSSGSVDADRLIISAIDQDSGLLRVATVSGQSPGLFVRGDWDNIGQRQTDSGTVEFRGVRVDPNDLLVTPGPLGSLRAALRPLIAQLILANVYLGLAEGAVLEAKRLGLEMTRPWFRSGLAEAKEDPYTLRHYGEFLVALEGTRLLVDHAGALLDEALALGNDIPSEERGKVALAVAAAKVSSSQVAVKLTSEVFEVLGARATTARYGLDRFWRNARTHTLHDPLDYKLRELGQYALVGQFPEPSFYS